MLTLYNAASCDMSRMKGVNDGSGDGESNIVLMRSINTTGSSRRDLSVLFPILFWSLVLGICGDTTKVFAFLELVCANGGGGRGFMIVTKGGDT